MQDEVGWKNYLGTCINNSETVKQNILQKVSEKF